MWEKNPHKAYKTIFSVCPMPYTLLYNSTKLEINKL